MECILLFELRMSICWAWLCLCLYICDQFHAVFGLLLPLLEWRRYFIWT